jgi:hypothetical protein
MSDINARELLSQAANNANRDVSLSQAPMVAGLSGFSRGRQT